jgi:D-alanyl-D-alanine dipeptidase
VTRVALVAALALACGGERSTANGERPTANGERRAANGGRPAVDDGRRTADGARPPADASPIAGADQVLVGIADGWDAVAVELALFARDGAGWRRIGEPWTGVLGAGGAGWGRGLHGDGAPAGAAGPIKREGDGRAPAGAFALGPSFGYAAAAVPGARLPYRALAPSWVCVDDPASARYNQVFDGAGVARDWASAETMRRRDELYRWVVEVGHNGAGVTGAPRPGAGSCIFLHVWRDAADGTAGCTAMPRDRLEALLAALDPAARPAYVLLPRDAHAALRAAWGLP